MKISGAFTRAKISWCGAGFKVLAVLAAIAGFGLEAGPAEASHASYSAAARPAKDRAMSSAAKDVETTSSIRADAESKANCEISRKKLFVEGEGWIVRRVATCY
ncbi:hypothetical protein GGR34_001642 [Microvirga flocculans]|uniref:Uncharacterized protein n=1 Tax=Microvirga flocculans TaxID=217168 RepID=A0A7W6IEH8_9HYPH|nr:hypothetical protein [Microvirga flocculans]MBB4039995.1 hypothetical protein [Microvirga flocculans]